jgi:hypothetical protein
MSSAASCNLTRFGGIILVLAAANGCWSHIEVAAQHDPGVDFRAYRTYAWMSRSRSDAVEPTDELVLVVRASVDHELNARGFRLGNTGVPDLLVGFGVRFRNRTTDSFTEYYAYRLSGGEDSPHDAYMYGYEEGTLAVDIIDAHTRQPLWHATVTAVVGDEPSAERVRDAVHAMFERLPMGAPE